MQHHFTKRIQLSKYCFCQQANRSRQIPRGKYVHIKNKQHHLSPDAAAYYRTRLYEPRFSNTLESNQGNVSTILQCRKHLFRFLRLVAKVSERGIAINQKKDFSVLSRLVSHLMIPRFALHTLHNAKYVYMITPVTPTVTPFTL